MTISTKSAFIYGFLVDETNYTLDFSEGGPELQANLEQGDYTITEMAAEIARALNAVGGQVYSVALNRTTRKFTVSAPGNFELLCSSGTRVGLTGYTLIGYTGSNKTGTNSYLSNVVGSYWEPQNVIEEYIPFAYMKEKIDPSINESASGIIEAVFFGTRSLMEGVFRLITNKTQTTGRSFLTNNPTGIADALAFMAFATNKYKIEFIPDKTAPSTFHKCIIERTEGDGTGTSYTLEKEFDEAIQGYYTLGKITFREVT